jgi:hypothetical protein
MGECIAVPSNAQKAHNNNMHVQVTVIRYTQ